MVALTWGYSWVRLLTSARSAQRKSHSISKLFIRWPRKDAGSINRAFVSWLSQRREPGRPFFAFLNYCDAHAPYVLPDGAAYRFGLAPPANSPISSSLTDYWETIDKLDGAFGVATHGPRPAYDNCVAYLDQCLGELFDEGCDVKACSVARSWS